MNNRYLIIIFLVLLAVFVALDLFSDKDEKSFDDNLARVDTATVDMIKIIPGEKGKKPFVLKKAGKGWRLTLEGNNKSYKANPVRIKRMLGNFTKIKATNIVTKNPDKYEKYEVGDKNSKEIILYSDGKKLLDLIIGKFKFNPQNRSAVTYIRKKGDKAVYATSNFSSFDVSTEYNSYLDMTVSKFDRQKLNAIDVKAGEKHLNLQKINGRWDYEKMDSTKLEAYISSLSNMYGNKTVDFDGTQKEVAGTVDLRFDGEKDITI